MPDSSSRRQNRREFLRTVSVGASVIALGAWRFGDETVQQPNIVIIFTDDQGYADVGKYGAKGFATPNLDRMASEGVMFTDFYVAEAVCSASRAALLTGCYSERVSIHGALMPWSTIGLNPEEETIASILKKKGYATGIFGKWHLGVYNEFLPLQHGFDEYLGLPYSNDMWPVDFDGRPLDKGAKSSYPPLPLMEGNEKVGEIRTLADQDKLTTIYTERAVRFIERHKRHPFFLYVPHSMPHVPLGVSSKFRGKSAQGMYGDVMMEIDWSVGEILKAIVNAGVDENTLVIFASDNGPWLNFGNHAGSALPLREGKGCMFEGGARVPCIMRWPGQIPPATVCRKIASTVDILPTIAAVCAAPLPVRRIDGVDILPLMEGEKNANPRDHFFFYYDGELRAVRRGKWKLDFPHNYRSYEGVTPGRDGHPGPYAKGHIGLALFDLEHDIGEKVNVADQHPDIVRELEDLGATARQDLGDALTNTKGRGVRPPGRAQSGLRPDVHTLALGKTIVLAHACSPKYAGSGDKTLIDGKRGSLDHADGAWQGFEGVDLDAQIDLGQPLQVHRITVGFLENLSAWIFLPKEVEIGVSNDGGTYDIVKRFEPESTSSVASPYVRDFGASVTAGTLVRFVRVIGRNIGICPEWHAGAGNKAWLFADEIAVE
jgi:arylsulfatase A-like enzyme